LNFKKAAAYGQAATLLSCRTKMPIRAMRIATYVKVTQVSLVVESGFHKANPKVTLRIKTAAGGKLLHAIGSSGYRDIGSSENKPLTVNLDPQSAIDSKQLGEQLVENNWRKR
jgi:hypothetical protein